MKKILQLALATFLIVTSTRPVSAQTTACEYWIAPNGNNATPGTSSLPWANLDYASAQLYRLGKSNCTVWAKDGIYNGITDLSERFSAPITFKAVNPYKAVLQNNNTVIKLSGVKNVIFDGFEIRHSSATSGAFLVYGSMSGSVWAENITFRNNILHDSYNQDLVKFTAGVRFITFENNVLYNQGPNEQHMDINSVTDVTIQDNIFFNDFEGSNRLNGRNTKHFIVIKDSSGSNDGMLGAQRITISKNIFMHYQGGNEAFVQVGNDGNPYYEAIDVRIENNLMLGDGLDSIGAVLGVAGAKDVTFVNNTVVGNLPANAYAFRILTKGSNPQNQNITFYNNIWSDPTGTMNKFSSGTASMTSGLRLDNNLYWNGSAAIPSGDLVSATADVHRIVSDSKLNINQTAIIFSRWDGMKFKSGNTTIRQEFLRLVNLYGSTFAGSAAIDKANPAYAPSTDILGNARGTMPDIGSFENINGTLAVAPTNTQTLINTPTSLASNTPIQTNVLSSATPTLAVATNTSISTATSLVVPLATNAVTVTSTNLPANTNTTAPTITNTVLPTLTNTTIPTATKTSAPAATNTSPPTVTSISTNAPGSAPDLIFSDEFESGSIATWNSSSTDGSDLSVASSAIPDHGQGVKVDINDQNTLYLEDNSPVAETRYRTRFYFDPNSITMASGDYLYILQAYANTTNTIVLRIQFKNNNGAYQLRAKSLDDSGTDQSTSYVTVSDAPHWIEVEWLAAAGAGANNGSLNFWIDGVPQGSLTGIDNDTYRMERVRIGAVYFNTTATNGILFFDGFVSRRQTYIGP